MPGMRDELLQLTGEHVHVRLAQESFVRAGNHTNINAALGQPAPTQIFTRDAIARLFDYSQDQHAASISLRLELWSRKINTVQHTLRRTTIGDDFAPLRVDEIDLPLCRKLKPEPQTPNVMLQIPEIVVRVLHHKRIEN